VSFAESQEISEICSVRIYNPAMTTVIIGKPSRPRRGNITAKWWAAQFKLSQPVRLAGLSGARDLRYTVALHAAIEL